MTPEEKAAQEAEAAKAKQEEEAEANRIAAMEKEDLLKEIAKLNSESAGRRVANNDLQEKLDKIEAERKEADEKAAAEKGEYKELYEKLKADLDGGNSKVEAMTATLQSYLDAEIALLPEDIQDLVPAGDIADQLDWIARAKVNPRFKSKGGPGVTLPGEDGPDALEAQLAEAQKAGNVTLIMHLKNQIRAKNH